MSIFMSVYLIKPKSKIINDRNIAFYSKYKVFFSICTKIAYFWHDVNYVCCITLFNIIPFAGDLSVLKIPGISMRQ